MSERFGKDTIIALATVENEVPFVRYVNAYYENGAFYIITYALSNKMRHMESNSTVAIAGEWFTAHGKSINLGYFGKEENYRIAEKLKKVFSEWIDNPLRIFSIRICHTNRKLKTKTHTLFHVKVTVHRLILRIKL